MKKLLLIHPLYLDVPMLVSFVAAIQGGISFGSEVTSESERTKSASGNVSAKFGLSNLISNLFDLSAETNLSAETAGRNQETRKESKSHTEASLAILLYDLLLERDEVLIRPQSESDLSNVSPGTLVEVAGTLEKNAVDAVIDHIDALTILSNLGTQQVENKAPGKGTGKQQSPKQQTQLEKIRDKLDEDRKRTPISSVILRCKEPSDMNVVVTLRRANLRDLTLTELHKNSVRVIGKVTRVITKDQSMSAFENYGMGMLKADLVKGAFDTIVGDTNLATEFSEVQIKGPTVQILPLMIFV